MDNKVKYYIASNNEFVIDNYNLATPFSNFLPGIAGLFGIPMWAFYVNRAQCVCSFGVKSKDNPIMEFLPANRAYQLTSSQGFRTFIKINDGKRPLFHEPFRPYQERGLSIEQRMYISSHELRLKETASSIGLEIEVAYFTIPNEPFPALGRILTLRNISRKTLKMEVLDGLPIIIPYGISDFFLHKMRRTIEAWMLVENLEKKAPFYRLKVDPRDISEVTLIEEGNFYIASLSTSERESQLPVFVEPELIFGNLNDFSKPAAFINQPNFNIPARQIGRNKLPCAMSLAQLRLKKSEEACIYSIAGHINSKENLNSLAPRLAKKQFFIERREENKAITQELKGNMFTLSDDKGYDLYCGQTFLDNILRGGYPISSGDHSSAFYVYSRKHGDLERDYNSFYIEPTYFSQGNGNFRDMNQNRRNDVLFNPAIMDSNILHFYNLQQADGFNPLTLHGVRFRLKKDADLLALFNEKISEKDITILKEGALRGAFSPGGLFMYMEKSGIKLKFPWHEFLNEILKNSEAIYDAEHGEGFWIDHWTYNLDLVESFLSVYPEKLKEILLDKKEFTFYDNIFCVRPRIDRYLSSEKNGVRQYYAVIRDTKKDQLIKKRHSDPHIMRMRKGEGPLYKTTLMVKLLCLTANKLSSLDPFGSGIEMEADKPGWCDSMNGLPGLLGSSTPEVFELKRQIVFMLDSLKSLDLEKNYKVQVPEELYEFLKKIAWLVESYAKISAKKRDFYYWDKSNSLKEKYRALIRFGFSGIEKGLSLDELEKMLKSFLVKIDASIRKAYIPAKHIYATYFINEVTRFEYIKKLDPVKNMPLVKPKEFRKKSLPLFLEGVVRAIKVEKDIKKVRRLYKALKKTGIYDKKLKMYKINESLEGVSKEVGRSSIFTPGWLENESIWLHMEYKYILELLKAGLYREFFEEFRNVLIPFQDPKVYGRSIFENSSFLVSSAFPDKSLHGRGFVARLSGSTAEMLNIWLVMNIGKNPFFLDEEGDLNLKFQPVLPGWLFTKKAQNGFPKNIYAFKFLGKTTAVYHNPRMKNTAGRNSVRTRFIIIKYDEGKKAEIKRDVIGLPYAQDIRDGKVKAIDIYLG